LMCVDVPIVVCELCFRKVGGVISCLVGLVRGPNGATVSPDPPVSVSSIYAAIVYVPEC
jgi:hypothetical protein